MRRLAGPDVEIVASQASGVLQRTGVTANEAEAAAWTVQSGAGADDVKVGGARAIALALAVGRRARWPVLPWRIPGVPWLLDRIYELVATNRNRIPGDTPWCHQHPDMCVDVPS